MFRRASYIDPSFANVWEDTKNNFFMTNLKMNYYLAFYSDYFAIRKTVSKIHNSFVVRAIIIFYTKTVFITSIEQIQKKRFHKRFINFFDPHRLTIYVELRFVGFV